MKHLNKVLFFDFLSVQVYFYIKQVFKQMEDKKLSITELQSYYYLIHSLIDDAIKRGQKVKHSPTECFVIQSKLNEYNEYRDKIIKKIEENINETFN